MNRIEIECLIIKRIKSCYKDLLLCKSRKSPKVYLEGFRCRLDEMLLLYHLINKISFLDACKELGIKYEDVDSQNYAKESRK